MPRQLRPTRAGWGFLTIIMGVGFAALNTGNNLLYLVLSLMLAFLVLSGLLSESALRGIEIRRRLPREVFADGDNPVLIEVHNGQRRIPAFALLIEDRARSDSAALRRLPRPARRGRQPETVGRVFALRVAPESLVARTYMLRPPHRGALSFHSVRVATRFPFGLFLKSRTIEALGDALVYPAVEHRASQMMREQTSARVGSERARMGPGSDVAGVRGFEAGDSARRIHWKSSLRRSDLQVREFEEEQSAEIEVRLRTALAAAEEGPADLGFEDQVRWAASEVVTHLEDGLRVGLLTDRLRIAPEAGSSQRSRILNLLAVIEREEPETSQAPSISRATPS